MAKYIIELEDEPMIANSFNHEVDELWKAKGFNSLVFDQKGIKKLTPYTEPDRKAIEDAQEEAWEFAKQVTIMTPDDKCELWGTSKYNTINLGYSYAEAKAKYEEWQKQKEEIHVGDEVTSKYGDGVVIDIVGNESVHILGKDGHWNEYAEGEYKKTGRHFDTVKKLLEEMRGEE